MPASRSLARYLGLGTAALIIGAVAAPAARADWHGGWHGRGWGWHGGGGWGWLAWFGCASGGLLSCWW